MRAGFAKSFSSTITESPQDHDDQIIIDVPKGGYVPIFKAASKMNINKRPNYRLVAS
jgi:hypothetical protein